MPDQLPVSVVLTNLPQVNSKRIALRVTPEAQRALRQGHPWLFDQSITKQSHPGEPGDLAVVFDRNRKFLAVGLYDPLSPIRVRVLQHREPVEINQAWFEAKLGAACEIRQPLLKPDLERQTTGCRLVHGENDGLPGLVVDRYETTLVVKLYSPAWIPHLRDVMSALTTVTHYKRLVLRLRQGMLEDVQARYGLEDGQVLAGPSLDGPVLFSENGLRFEADMVFGHKTGFYFDQRDNRSRVEKLAGGKMVLNVFAYTGAFSVYAARGGALEVTSVDISRPALDAARQNFAHNSRLPAVASAHHEVVVGDAFQVMKQMDREDRRFEMVVIDPPSFAHRQDQTSQAVSAYSKLTRLGLNLLQPGGVLVQASCSSRVSPEEFFEAIHRAASQANSPLHEIERSSHALDHPVTFPEGGYLKCLFAVAS